METNQALIDKYLTKVLLSNFPYDFLSKSQIVKEYKKICIKEPTINSNIGLSLVEHFHPSIWRCNKLNYKSPVDAWHDSIIISKTIQNRLKYIGPELSLRQIRRGLSVGRFAPKVSVFRPMTAKYLIKKYLNSYSTIFDPCMGFSGRLLGAASLAKHYIGIDINSVTCAEACELQKELGINAEIICADSLYRTSKYKCLFTCPPYGNKEHWHQDIEELSADEWIDVCLKNYDCEAYLFVVDDTAKYKDFIVEEIKNRSHFNITSEKVIFIKKDSSEN